MAIKLQKESGERHKINEASYAKGSVVVVPGRFGEYFTLMRDNSPMFLEVHWTEFVDGDNADAQFASLTALQEYFDSVFSVLLPVSRPFRLVSLADTNSTLVKAGKTVIHSIAVVNTAEVTRYLKIYDTAVAPIGADTPALVFPIVAQAEDKPINLLPVPLLLYNGFGFRITADIDDAGEGAIGANEVFLNAIYQ